MSWRLRGQPNRADVLNVQHRAGPVRCVLGARKPQGRTQWGWLVRQHGFLSARPDSHHVSRQLDAVQFSTSSPSLAIQMSTAKPPRPLGVARSQKLNISRRIVKYRIRPSCTRLPEPVRSTRPARRRARHHININPCGLHGPSRVTLRVESPASSRRRGGIGAASRSLHTHTHASWPRALRWFPCVSLPADCMPWGCCRGGAERPHAVQRLEADPNIATSTSALDLPLVVWSPAFAWNFSWTGSMLEGSCRCRDEAAARRIPAARRPVATRANEMSLAIASVICT
ncbi:hypothetical protein QBC34DRAFT_190174 [Podospora aff. communis PSN243]|uniref:Uncharacterized protein n=1 Tax=Podospora aff. communis PSN243 TaxID=3040156 RepID=A0AAV9GXE5_9PEZI|nr:hypothetical protein QBC34DRAFT_190174 [Podospora aff. communis PSN243]